MLHRFQAYLLDKLPTLEDPAVRRAFVDQLTGLPTRYVMLDALRGARLQNVPGTALLADVDHFKPINDRYGHLQGDALLGVIARHLQENLPATALLSRIGGDEFMAFLPRVGAVVAEPIVRECMDRMRGPISSVVGPDAVTLSVGLADFAGQPIDEILKGCDIAMYAAKARGRDRVVVFDEQTRSIATARRELASTVIELERRNRALHDEARTDALTGLRNRKALDEFLDIVVGTAGSRWQEASVAFVDIDHFGIFNKLHGDAGGDDVLRSVARAIQGSVREAGLVFRKGGEEMVVIVPEARREAATAAAERIRASVEKLGVPHAGSAVAEIVTVTVGVASAAAGHTIREVLNAAANCAMAAKLDGQRNRVHQAELGPPSLP